MLGLLWQGDVCTVTTNTGTVNSVDSVIPATKYYMGEPEALAADYASETYYVADTGNARILAFTRSGIPANEWKILTLLPFIQDCEYRASVLVVAADFENIFFYSRTEHILYKMSMSPNNPAVPELVAGSNTVGVKDGIAHEVQRPSKPPHIPRNVNTPYMLYAVKSLTSECRHTHNA